MSSDGFQAKIESGLELLHEELTGLLKAREDGRELVIIALCRDYILLAKKGDLNKPFFEPCTLSRKGDFRTPDFDFVSRDLALEIGAKMSETVK